MKPLSKRQRALAIIQSEFAKHGRSTEKVMVLYVESSISRKALEEAATRGLIQHKPKEVI